MLVRAVNEAGIPARSLAIEITESSTARGEIAMETIFQLRQEGYSVHIDDFGTGYSSLAYLHELSVDAIKIDIAFTQAIGTGSALVSILPQLIGITQALNLEMIVEGVETEEQADYYRPCIGTNTGAGLAVWSAHYRQANFIGAWLRTSRMRGVMETSRRRSDTSFVGSITIFLIRI